MPAPTPDSDESFACPACGAAFTYRPPPGRKVLCTCGHAFLPDQNLYDVAEDAPKPAPKPAAKPPPAPTPPPRTDARPAPPRRTDARPAPGRHTDARPAPPRRTATVAQEEPTESRARDVLLPLALLAAGILLWTGRVLVAPPAGLTRPAALVLTACQMVVAVALAVAGGAASLRFVDTDPGPPGRAVLKTAAVSVFAAACAVLAVSMDASPTHVAGAVVAAHLAFLVYAFFLWVLFRLDVQETLVASVVILALQSAAAFVLLKP